MAPTEHDPFALARLRRQWALLCLLAAALLWAGYRLLAAQWAPAPALIWAALAAAALVYQLVFHFFDLELNHRPGQSALLAGLGPGTWLSLLRLLVFGLMAGFLVLPRPPGWLAWLPFALNLLANATDFFDGYLARVSGQVTALGGKLDQDLDGRGLLLVSLLAYGYGAVPAWFLLVGAARYLFLFGIGRRERRGLPLQELAPNRARRALAGAQMGLTTALLAPILGPPETVLAAAFFTLPFLANFLYDYLQVTGNLPQSILGWPGWRRLWAFARGWLPLGLRAAAVLLLLLRLAQDSLGSLFGPADLLLIASLSLGAAVRLMAMLGLILTGFHIHFLPGYTPDLWLVAALSLIAYLGSGLHSTWTPEEAWIERRAGERPPP